MTRSFTLLETMLAAALLALLGVAVLRFQSAALVQVNRARELNLLTASVETLLWEWRAGRVPVTLPSSGRLADHYSWERRAKPVRLGAGAFASEVTLTIHDDRQPDPKPVAALYWLVVPAGKEADK